MQRGTIEDAVVSGRNDGKGRECVAECSRHPCGGFGKIQKSTFSLDLAFEARGWIDQARMKLAEVSSSAASRPLNCRWRMAYSSDTAWGVRDGTSS